jgi:hypothetical protein
LIKNNDLLGGIANKLESAIENARRKPIRKTKRNGRRRKKLRKKWAGMWDLQGKEKKKLKKRRNEEKKKWTLAGTWDRIDGLERGTYRGKKRISERKEEMKKRRKQRKEEMNVGWNVGPNRRSSKSEITWTQPRFPHNFWSLAAHINEFAISMKTKDQHTNQTCSYVYLGCLFSP